VGKKLQPGEQLTEADKETLDIVEKAFGKRKGKRQRVMVASLTLTSVAQEAYGSHCANFYQLGRDCKDYDFAFVSPRRLAIDSMRNMCVQLAIEGDFKYLYFFDDDTVNDFNVLGRLLKRGKEFNAISASYFVRGYPFNLMAFRWIDLKDKKKGFRLFKGNEFKKFIDEDGVIRNLGAIGNGCTLYRVEDFKQIVYPWFATGPNFTEDAYWFQKAHMNIEDYNVGMDMNIRCGHLCQPVYVDLQNVSVLRAFHKRLQKVGGLSQ
jgi:hypothetical protein